MFCSLLLNKELCFEWGRAERALLRDVFANYCHCDLSCPEQTNDTPAASLRVMIRPFASRLGFWLESAHYGGSVPAVCAAPVLVMPAPTVTGQHHTVDTELFLFNLLWSYTSVLVQMPYDLRHL